MKHLVKLAFLLLALLLPTTATAHDFEVDGIYYNILNVIEAAVTYSGTDCWNHNTYSGSVTIPSSVTYNGTTYSVTSIGNHAFYSCRGLTSVDIPNSVTTIDRYAFGYCTGLTNIKIPNSVTTIGDYAFSVCSGLTNVIIGNSVTFIGDGAFYGCSGLTSIEIPNSVTTIAESAFSDCSALTSVIIGNSVTSIGGGAFYGCIGLTSIEIPNSVTSIGGGAFNYCSGLMNITVASGNSTYDSRNNCNAIIETASNTLIVGCKNTIIPNTVTAIGGRAFSGCSGLTSVTIPNSVTSIEGGAFSLCSGITDLIWNARNCYNTGSMPTSNIERVVIGNEVELLPSNFVSGSNITSVDIPNSVNTISAEAFYNCSGLTSVAIPNSVTFIGNQAFSGCSNITDVIIGNSTATIGEGAFLRSPRISKVTSLNKVPPACNANLFSDNVYIHAVLYVPNASVSEYISTDAWGPFFHVEGLETSDIVLANSVTLDRQNMIIGVGTTSRLIATVLPDTATNKAVTWASSNPAVATVDDNGLVTAIVPGSAVITVMTTDGSNLSASCSVETFNDMSQYSDYLSMSDTAVFHGKTIVIPVKMFNEADVISFQTDIFLPEGLELLQEDGEYIIDPSERMTRTHSIMSDNVSNGSIRVLCYSSNYKPFTGNSGDDLFYLTLKVADDAEGDYTIQLKNTLLTNTDFVDMPAPDVAASVNVKAYILGDANNSRLVTVGDVVATAQYVLEQNPQPFIFEAADVNFDGNITVADVSRIAWMVLNPGAKAPRRAPALLNSGDRMSGEGISLMPGETRRVSLALDNALDYSAFQLDLSLPEGLTASDFQLTDRASSHAFDVNTLGGGKFRALCYSPALTAISGHEGALLTFDVTANAAVTGDIMVDGIELVTTACESVRLDGFAIDVNSASGVNEQVAGKTVARMDYYNLAGQQIDRPVAGVTLVVITYTDGTRTTAKVIK